MSKKFVELDTDNETLLAYYDDNINETIPVGAFEITQIEYDDALAINANKFIGGFFVFVEKVLTCSEEATLARANRLDAFRTTDRIFFAWQISGLSIDEQAWRDAVAQVKLDFPIEIGFNNEAFSSGFGCD